MLLYLQTTVVRVQNWYARALQCSISSSYMYMPVLLCSSLRDLFPCIVLQQGEG